MLIIFLSNKYILTLSQPVINCRADDDDNDGGGDDDDESYGWQELTFHMKQWTGARRGLIVMLQVINTL